MSKPQDQSETGCCKEFDPELWDEQEITFNDKLFLKEKVRSFFHMPVNFGKVMTRAMKQIEEAHAMPDEYLALSHEKSLWSADLFISIKKEVPNAINYEISGTFITKVFEGPYKFMGAWIKEMNEFVASKEKEVKKMYFYYTTCPKCAKQYGKNYVVIFAEV